MHSFIYSRDPSPVKGVEPLGKQGTDRDYEFTHNHGRFTFALPTPVFNCKRVELLTYSTTERLLRQNRYANPTGATKIANDQHMAMVKAFTISMNSAFTKKTLLPMM